MQNYEYNQEDCKRRAPRNFVKENLANIKSIQRLMNMNNKVSKSKTVKGSDKFQNVPNWAPDSRGDTSQRTEAQTKPEITRKELQAKNKNADNYSKPKLEDKVPEGNQKIKNDKKNARQAKAGGTGAGTSQIFSHRSVQTADDPSKLYETGVVKYASQQVTPSKSKCKTSKPPNMEGDQIEVDDDETKRRDYVKENMSNLKPKTIKPSPVKVPSEPPPTYQKGVLPKYLQDRKAENATEEDDLCPPGHVLLPESERKETLRVLRQSYADRIQELNGLPVRSDTLRVRKKKMEIEEELKKIDSGIKVFQRPKVYVKINS